MSRKTGQYYESLAADFLTRQGLVLLEKNFHGYRGEIDLVMKDNQTLVFVEVKFRKNALYGSPADMVTLTKQHRLSLTAAHYLQLHRLHSLLACRFDVIAICGTKKTNSNLKIDWIKNAFLIT